MSKLPDIQLQRTLISVGVTSVTPSSTLVRFARISANFDHKLIPGQV